MMATTASSTLRVLLAKPGLDGHDRGVKVIAMALRDAGAEVIYLGLRQTPAMIAEAALSEDADVIGISVLSGAHVALTHDILDSLRRSACTIPLVVGGTVPPSDVTRLLDAGVAGVYPVGTPLAKVVEAIMAFGPEDA